MSKRFLSVLGLTVVLILMAGILTAAAPAPLTTFTLVSGLPATMQVGESYPVVIQVTSDQPFILAQAMPTEFFPGRAVVANQGDHASSGTSALLTVMFTAKDSTLTAKYGGAVPVSVIAGVRYQGGVIMTQRFDFFVTVP
jgi:hypothetical protein